MVERGIDKKLVLCYIEKLKSPGFKFSEKAPYPVFDTGLLNDKERFEEFKKYCMELKNTLLSK